MGRYQAPIEMNGERSLILYRIVKDIESKSLEPAFESDINSVNIGFSTALK